MPQAIDVHLNQALTQIAIAYPSGNFISPRFLAEVPVSKQTDSYFIFDSERQKESQSDDKRTPGSPAHSVDYDVSEGTYACVDHALQKQVTDEEQANSDPPLRPFRNAAQYLSDRILVNQEIGLKTILDANITQTATPGNNWDTDSGTPISDINTAINTIEDATSFTPNVMGMDSKAWRALRNNPEIVERVLAGGTNDGPANITTSGVAELFGLEEILVSTASKNTAVQGQTASMSRIWGGDVYLAYRPPVPALELPAFGYRMVWQFGPGGRGANGYNMFTFRDADETKKSDVVAIEKYYDQKVTLANAGYRIIAII